MKLRHHQYFTYMTTNSRRTVIYVGMSNNLPQRITEHWLNRGKPETFAGRYYCFNLVYYKTFKYVNDSRAWEDRLKGWSRAKKAALIEAENPTWRFMNEDIMSWPPPPDSFIRGRRS